MWHLEEGHSKRGTSLSKPRVGLCLGGSRHNKEARVASGGHRETDRRFTMTGTRSYRALEANGGSQASEK